MVDIKDNDDWLSPKLRNVTDKLTTLRHAITDNNTIGIGYIEDDEPNTDWGMVNDWLNHILSKEEYPTKEQLILANKLWKKYRVI